MPRPATNEQVLSPDKRYFILSWGKYCGTGRDVAIVEVATLLHDHHIVTLRVVIEHYNRNNFKTRIKKRTLLIKLLLHFQRPTALA